MENTKELYSTYGSKYPYACDAVAYFIFNSKDDDNIVRNSILGKLGRDTEIDESEASEIMLSYEYSWRERMEDIEEEIRELPTKGGETLSTYY